MNTSKIPPKTSGLFDATNNLSEQQWEALWKSPSEPILQGKYIHWDKLVYYPLPEGVTHKLWWFAIKLSRQPHFKKIPLIDTNNQSFKYMLADPIPERLHQIDQGSAGHIQAPIPVLNSETKDQYYFQSLIQEAITSSQLEGASTTRQVAKKMIQESRKPKNRSEQMILNNYLTMRRISNLKDETLTRDLVFELHRLITEDTLDDPSAVGRFRRSDESIAVVDQTGKIFHQPPPAEELEDRMEAMCAFANKLSPDGFVHPAVRAIILHFWLGYDHPFVDGNGRTARALFYWAMLKYGFWLCEYISISNIILKAPSKYSRAFLYTETDENDLTYFINYHVDVIKRAIENLHDYITYKTQKVEQLEQRLRGITFLNHRQRDLIGHALRHPHFEYTIESHRIHHNVVHQTARQDLNDLFDKGLLTKFKIGKFWNYTPVTNLEGLLESMR